MATSSKMRVDELIVKFKSKKDLYRRLTIDKKISFQITYSAISHAIIQNVSSTFTKGILSGESQ